MTRIRHILNSFSPTRIIGEALVFAIVMLVLALAMVATAPTPPQPSHIAGEN